MYALSPIRVHYYNQTALNEFMLNKHFFVLYLLQSMKNQQYQNYLLFGKTNWYQNIAIIISTKCVNDGKCPFNTDSQHHKQPFSLLPSARSHDVKRWHDKSLYIIQVNTLSATFIQE